jgi:flagellar hook assembly protein FlgD
MIARGGFTAGHPTVTWDGRDDRGATVRAGVYFLRAVSGGVSHRLKLLVLQ